MLTPLCFNQNDAIKGKSMQNAMIDQLASEIMQLKRENRWIKGLIAAMAACLVVFCSLGAMRLEEDHITLKDPNTGRPRITLGTNPANGSTGIEILDTQGRRRIILATGGLPNEDPALAIFHANGVVIKDFK